MITALVTARGGSKGLPGKNLRQLGGRPLIQWSIEAALEATGVDRVVVSTDDAGIADVARQSGAEVPFLRPAELAGDRTPHADVLRHALEWMAEREGVPEWLLLLQPTSPLRSAADISGAIELARRHCPPAVVSVTVPEHHPLLCYQVNSQGALVRLAYRETWPSLPNYLRRQDLPPVYVLNGAIYLLRSSVFVETDSIVPEGALPYIMPPERSMDIDTELDLEQAERALARAQSPAAVGAEKRLKTR